MYRYNDYDRRIGAERVAQFRGQTARFLAGELTEDEFRPLRLQNGLYVQRHAPMLRVAIPYGLLSANQLRKLAHIARTYDRGYGHFTTRQNIQFNWPALERVPDILAELAQVEMHAIQTSGNCVRNITTDALAGIAPDEIVDPRPYCELLRQWSTFHPEFAFLPRKFKIAISGADLDRAVVRLHDIGIELYRDSAGEVLARMYVGGGMGRTPIVAPILREGLPWQHLMTYCEAVLRVYNLHGRRDNKYKARIKILVKALGAEAFAEQVEAEFAQLKDGPHTLTAAERDRVARHFSAPAYRAAQAHSGEYERTLRAEPAFARWVERNVAPHREAGYAAVTLSLKRAAIAPGDATADEMDAVADLADRYSFGELRVSHRQNLVLSDVPRDQLPALWRDARALGLANPTLNLLTDMIACPGGDFCSLANARSIPIAESIQQRFDDLDYLHDLGELKLNISGCINSCGHHHNGHIGILGVDKNDQEFYQISIGGRSGEGVQNDTRVGQIIGPSFSAVEVPGVIAALMDVYVAARHADERFIDTFDRIGLAPFKTAVYGEGQVHREREAAHV
ncbi:nitrite/sulfite reductase [Piscinibacterium candidicorallinum]|uniref:Nitrite/sulfite reductase n=1 Tax=Piscinibacterium candidicorallinum TaxID=1793872 RepID=A0ABV7H7F8_9BURK